MTDAKTFLINYFKKITNINDERLLSADYLKGGLIDSLQFIIMVNDIEKNFKISFSSSELESDDFRTVNGLASIINKLRAKNSSIKAK